MKRDIPGYEGLYTITEDGIIFCCEKNGKKERQKKTSINRGGYEVVGLWKNGRSKTVTVHSLVALTFIGKRKNCYQINHKNGVKSDNNVMNLEYVTSSENIKHAWKNKLIVPTEKFRKSCRKNFIKNAVPRVRKLTYEMAEKVRERVSNGERRSVIARELMVSTSTITNIVNYKTYAERYE